jgi:hypothetical protein
VVLLLVVGGIVVLCVGVGGCVVLILMVAVFWCCKLGVM